MTTPNLNPDLPVVSSEIGGYSTPSFQLESKELDKIFTSLAKSQLEMEIAKTQNTNPYFKSKYAALSSIVKASRPFLAKNGMCVIQRTFKTEGGVFLQTRLGHTSGQWMASNIEVRPPKNDIQSLGSYLTYLRRYQYASLVGVVTGDEDDDGEAAMVSSRAEIAPSTITKEQLQVLSSELSSCPEILDSLFKGFKIAKLASLPSHHYEKCLERIRSIKVAGEKR